MDVQRILPRPSKEEMLAQYADQFPRESQEAGNAMCLIGKNF